VRLEARHDNAPGGRVARKAVHQQQRRAAAALEDVDALAVHVEEAAAAVGHPPAYSQPRLRK
jgi:hypothetical protein